MEKILELINEDKNTQLMLNSYKDYVKHKYEYGYNFFKEFKKKFDSTPEANLDNFKPSPEIRVDSRELKAFMQGGYNRLMLRRFAEFIGYDFSKPGDDPNNQEAWWSFIHIHRHTWLIEEPKLLKHIERISTEYMQEAAQELASYIHINICKKPESVELRHPEFHATYVTGTIWCKKDADTYITQEARINYQGGDTRSVPFKIIIQKASDTIKV